jgi:UPF0176 protein
MQKIILFYKFTPISDTEAIRLWQRNLCERLNLKGRIIIAEHGINGTLGGQLKDLKAYVKETKSYAAFKTMPFKWSDGQHDDFPRLSIKIRPEIVSFGIPDKIAVDQNGVIGGGQHLNPKQLHELIESRDEDITFFDGRNAYEAEVGKFKNAVVPNTRHTRDFQTELDDPKYDSLKNKPVVTYCTGGIRCEILSMLMKQKGFQEVYQLDGGIIKYGQEFGDSGLWEGSLYVFDDRLTTQFSNDAQDIGSCSHCGAKTSNFVNCSNKACNDLILVCQACVTDQTACLACMAEAAI